jgi:hypothetical protein
LALARELLAVELERSVRGTDDAPPAGPAVDGPEPAATPAVPLVVPPTVSSPEEAFS